MSYWPSNDTLSSALDFYMATMPGAMSAILMGSTYRIQACAAYGNQDPERYFESATILHCQMVKTTYNVAFDYTGSQQNIRMTSSTAQDAQKPLGQVDAVNEPPRAPTGNFAESDCSVLNSVGDVCEFDQTLLEALSYQAILEAFSGIIFGTVRNPATTAPIFETGILNTPLINTPELSFLGSPIVIASMFSSSDLQEAVQQSNGTLLQGLAKNRTDDVGVPLARATENLFADTVVSMISSKQLQYVIMPIPRARYRY